MLAAGGEKPAKIDRLEYCSLSRSQGFAGSGNAAERLCGLRRSMAGGPPVIERRELQIHMRLGVDDGDGGHINDFFHRGSALQDVDGL